MIYFPTCKINLGLHILEKRSDGYHEIETTMLEIPYTDVLEVIVSEEDRFSSSGQEIPGDNNSCVAALKLLRKDFEFHPMQIHLHKELPTGAGLGGGSADSTFTLKAINEIAQLNLTESQLEKYAAQLGSDNAFFVKGGFQLGKGRGELLSELTNSLKGYYIYVLNIGLHVSTAEAYAKVIPNSNRNELSELVQMPISTWKNNLVNDFELSVFEKYPELSEIKEKLYEEGAIYAAMSGSGSTLFGIFAEEKKIEWDRPLLVDKWLKL